jgi:predicted HicB family RNase H-like nuclease
MKEEYDFSNAERGKFCRDGVELVPPVHLEPEILEYLSLLAAARGISVNTLVNELLKKHIELIETVK